MNYTVTLTQTQDRALSYAAVSQNDWIENAITQRCEAAIEEIVKITVAKCLETGTQIPGTKEGIVDLAFEQEWIKTAAQVNEEYLAAAQATLEEIQARTAE